MAYKPGERNKRFQQNYKISRNRRAWAKVAGTAVAFMHYLDEDEPEEVEPEEGVQTEAATESGPTSRLVFTKYGYRRTMTIDLTMMSEDELRAVKRVIDLAFDYALPVVIQRDQEARDAFAQGDDSNTRNYRQVPEFTIRQGSEREHDPSLWYRPEDLHPGVPGRSDGNGVRGAGDGLAEPLSQGPGHGEPQDDISSAD